MTRPDPDHVIELLDGGRGAVQVSARTVKTIKLVLAMTSERPVVARWRLLDRWIRLTMPPPKTGQSRRSAAALLRKSLHELDKLGVLQRCGVPPNNFVRPDRAALMSMLDRWETLEAER